MPTLARAIFCDVPRPNFSKIFWRSSGGMGDPVLETRISLVWPTAARNNRRPPAGV